MHTRFTSPSHRRPVVESIGFGLYIESTTGRILSRDEVTRDRLDIVDYARDSSVGLS